MGHYCKKVGICLFIFILLIGELRGQNNLAYERDWRTDRKVVQVISYNIMDGFNWGKDKDRQARFVAWVKEKQPDILALQELCGFTENKLLELAKSYGHSYAAIVKENGYPVGITSSYPIEVIEKRVEGYGHGLLHCRILDLDFLITHLNPSDWKTRHQEAENITSYIKSSNLEQALIMGDFNAYSPFDASVLESHYLLLKSMLSSDLNNKNGKSNLNNGYPEYSVISTFLAFPLHDICSMFVSENKRSTFPTRILVNVPKGENLQQHQGRIDYIFVTDAVRKLCIDAYIYNGEDTDYLSDHYPVGVRLLMN